MMPKFAVVEAIFPICLPLLIAFGECRYGHGELCSSRQVAIRKLVSSWSADVS